MATASDLLDDLKEPLFGWKDAPFKTGSASEVKSGEAQFRPGGIVSKTSSTFVGRKDGYDPVLGQPGTPEYGTKVYHRTVIYTKQDSSGKVSGGDRVVYIIKDDNWQPAAILKDGESTYRFSDSDYPTMDGVAPAEFSNELNQNGANNTRQSELYKNVKEQAWQSTGPESAGVPENQRTNLEPSKKNNQLNADEPTTPRPSTQSPPKQPSSFRYPLDIDETDQDTLQIKIFNRLPRKFKGGVQNAASSRISGKADFVTLPIIGGASDQTIVDYQNNSLNFLQGAALQTFLEATKTDNGEERNQVTGTIGNLSQQLSSSSVSREVRNLVGTYAAKSALGAFAGGQTVNSLQSRFSGQILNPNLELLFNNPTLRNFSFTYLFLPRSRPEADQVIGIINLFKKSMVAQTTDGQFFLKSPRIFQLKYMHRGMEHTKINKFKDCALRSLNVEYTPQGTYATFPDGVMHGYRVTMQFTELDPVLSRDYDTTLTGDDFPGFLFADTLAEMGNGSGYSEIGF